MAGLIAYGAYVPYHRLRRSVINEALGKSGGTGARAVSSYDEDATTMAVEAARNLLGGQRARGVAPRRLLFASANPPYADKTNATVVHAALGLAPDVLAVDMMGSLRSSVGALVAGFEATVPTLVVMSDVRFGTAGSSEESESGDAAAALLFAPDDADPPGLELLAHASSTREFLDRWRTPGALTSRTWEDRFAEALYTESARDALTDALKQAGLSLTDVDHLAVCGLHARAARAVTRAAGEAKGMPSQLAESVGNTGAAAPGLALAELLDTAAPGQVAALCVLGDGATVFLVRLHEAIHQARPPRSLHELIATGSDALRYTTFLAWRGLLSKELPRRPEPSPPSPPAALRVADYKFGLVCSRCEAPTSTGIACNTVHLPPSRVCVRCCAADQMVPVPMSQLTGAIRTFTLDHLVYSPNPPNVSAVLDLAGGGRFTVDLTDVDQNTISIGDQVEMTFRRLYSTQGVHNYFWKGRRVSARSVTEA
jgi:hydroxymethylglutaryl-CoA synthase